MLFFRLLLHYPIFPKVLSIEVSDHYQWAAAQLINATISFEPDRSIFNMPIQAFGFVVDGFCLMY